MVDGCSATTIGSLPHRDVWETVGLVLRYTPEVPAWPQLPNLPGQGMLEQFAVGMPGAAREGDRLYFDTKSPSFEDELMGFYTDYLDASEAEDSSLERFSLPEENAVGIYALAEALSSRRSKPVAVKGQLTGPFTLGTGLTDQDRRCAYYDPRLREMIVKFLAMDARWQVRKLSGDWKVIIFVDEPGLSAFGTSTFLSVGEEDILHDLGEVADAIHSEGALAGVHCCGNTDWSLLLSTDIDILSFDSYEFFDRLALYPEDVGEFLGRGGTLSWGIVPSLRPDMLEVETVDSLVDKLEGQMARLGGEGIDADVLRRQCLITPSCGAGSLTEELARRALRLTSEVSRRLRDGA